MLQICKSRRKSVKSASTSQKIPQSCPYTDPSQIVIILDGTYIYIQKSSKFELQKGTWSMQKGRNLVKTMIVCSTDGYIIGIHGLHQADGHNNDVSILNEMMKVRSGIDTSLAEGRGYEVSNERNLMQIALGRQEVWLIQCTIKA